MSRQIYKYEQLASFNKYGIKSQYYGNSSSNDKEMGDEMEEMKNWMENIGEQFKKDKKIILISVVAGLLFTFVWGIHETKAYSDTIQSGIAEKVVRFHVLANSDEAFDQNLKLAVRDRILKEMGPGLQKCENVKETKELLKSSFGKIRETSLDEIQKQGYDYDVKVSLQKDAFPLKHYGDLTFPAGIYEALRVEIGKAEGNNWWCVMFPPMCYVDAACGEVTEYSKVQLSGKLTAEEYVVITAMEEKKGVCPKVKFKIVEWWQEKKAENAIEQEKLEEKNQESQEEMKKIHKTIEKVPCKQLAL